MKSRVHPKYKTQYRVSNWPDYDQALVQRGDLTIWITEEAIAAWVPDHTTLSRRGRHLIVDSTGLSIVGQGE